MKVQIQLKNNSRPIVYGDAEGAYEKGAFYCVGLGDEVQKYPLADIFRVVEDYGPHLSRERIEKAMRYAQMKEPLGQAEPEKIG